MLKKRISVITAITMVILLIFQSSSFAGMADGQSKFLGNILRLQIETDPTFGKYWNQVTPENSGKWAQVEKTRDTFDWSKLDDDYNYAKSKGYPFKEHCLIWGMSEPSWLKSLPAADIRAEIEEWIKAYFTRYPDTKFAEVVNEPIHQKPSQEVRNAMGGDTNWAWVKWAYEKAKLYKPTGCTLIINEFDVEKNSATRATYKQIISMLSNNGLLGGIGLQAHWLENTPASTIKAALDEMDDFGLPLYITEYEVDASDDNKQLDIYKSQFPVFWQHPAVKGVTLWGYKQGVMWRTNAYLLRSDGTERPALQWLVKYVGNALYNPGFESGTSNWSVFGSGTLATSTDKYAGTYSVKHSGRTAAWNGPSQSVKNMLAAKGQGSYDIGAWSKLGSGNDKVLVTIKLTDSNGTRYLSTTASNADTTWRLYSTNINITWSGTLSEAIFYVQTQTSNSDLFVDDCYVIKK